MIAVRRLVLVALAAAWFAIATEVDAQEQAPPDPRMLLNLDLFRPGSPTASASMPERQPSDSLLDQIRALMAMGYLPANPADSASAPGQRAANPTGDQPSGGPEGKP